MHKQTFTFGFNPNDGTSKFYDDDHNKACREIVVYLARLEFEAFTVIDTVGFWRGLGERGIRIEVVTPEADRKTRHFNAAAFIRGCKVRLEDLGAPQDCVMYEEREIEFVSFGLDL